MKFLVAAIFVIELAVVDFLYWARVTTFISAPGRFHAVEPMLDSGLVVFFFSPAIAAVAAGWIASTRKSGRLRECGGPECCFVFSRDVNRSQHAGELRPCA